MSQPEDEETREQPAYPEPAVQPTPPPLPASPTEQPQWQPQPPPAQPQWQPQSPPAAQQPYQAQPQSWQAPPAQPGWQQPQPGWQQQVWGAPAYGTSTLVVIAGVVLVVFGILVTLLGGFSLTQGPEIGRFIRDSDIAIFGRQIDRETMRTVLSPMPGILMVIGVLQLLVGAALFAHRSWARWLGVLLAILGLLVAVVAVSAALALAPGMSVSTIVAVVLLLGYAFVVLALIAGGSHFRARYPGR